MKTIRNWNDLEQYGINSLTGEACRLGMRYLCDLNSTGKGIIQRFFCIPDKSHKTPSDAPQDPSGPFAESWNQYAGGQKAIASIQLPRDIFENLAIFILTDHEKAKLACIEGFNAVGYFDTEEDAEFMRRFISAYDGEDSEQELHTGVSPVEAWSIKTLEEYNKTVPPYKVMEPEYCKIDTEYWRKADLQHQYAWLRSFISSYCPSTHLYGGRFHSYQFLQGQPGIGANATHAMSGRTPGAK